jgi:hypothetical protein
MNRTAPPGREVLRRGLEEVGRRLPEGWKVTALDPPAASRTRTSWRPDAVARVTYAAGKAAELPIVLLDDGAPSSVARCVARLGSGDRRPGGAVLLLAPYLPARSRDLVARSGLNYADLTGNLRLVIPRPALFLQDRGAEVDPYPRREVDRGLAGPTAGRLVLWLCQSDPAKATWRLAEVALGSRVSPSYASRLLEILERENLVRREPRGPIVAMDRPGLVRRWAEDYTLLGSNRGRLYLDPRGAGNALAALRSGALRGARFAVTGSFAAQRYAPVASPSRLVCFVDDPDAAARALDISPVSGTGNVFLLSPYDDGLLDDEREPVEGATEFRLRFVPAAQAAVDCLTGPDRMPEEGEALLAWLTENRPGWRGLDGTPRP